MRPCNIPQHVMWQLFSAFFLSLLSVKSILNHLPHLMQVASSKTTYMSPIMFNTILPAPSDYQNCPSYYVAQN